MSPSKSEAANLLEFAISPLPARSVPDLCAAIEQSKRTMVLVKVPPVRLQLSAPEAMELAVLRAEVAHLIERNAFLEAQFARQESELRRANTAMAAMHAHLTKKPVPQDDENNP